MRRSPAKYCYSPLPLDLHVLGLPLAFILSQDQTLHCNNILLKRIVLLFLPLLLFACIYYKHATLGFCYFNVLAQFPSEHNPWPHLRVQRYELFLFYQTFFYFFRELFYNSSEYQYHFFETFFTSINVFRRFFSNFPSVFRIFDSFWTCFCAKHVYLHIGQHFKCFLGSTEGGFTDLWNYGFTDLV